MLMKLTPGYESIMIWILICRKSSLGFTEIKFELSKSLVNKQIANTWDENYFVMFNFLAIAVVNKSTIWWQQFSS